MFAVNFIAPVDMASICTMVYLPRPSKACSMGIGMLSSPPSTNRHRTAINYCGNCCSDCVAIGCVILAVVKIAKITDILRASRQQRCSKIKVHMLEIGCVRRCCCTDGIGSCSAVRTDRGIRCAQGTPSMAALALTWSGVAHAGKPRKVDTSAAPNMVAISVFFISRLPDPGSGFGSGYISAKRANR